VRLWSISENTGFGILEGHSDSVWSVALTNNTEIVISGSQDRTVLVWGVKNSQLLFRLNDSLFGIDEVKLTSDDKYIFTGSFDRQSVRVWNVITGEKMSNLESLEEVEQWILQYPETRRLVENYAS
jgi:WD40 repeat protein